MTSLREEAARFAGCDGLSLHYRRWERPDLAAAPRCTLIISHGLNQHSGHYRHTAQYLVERGFRVIALDHRGNGESEGDRCYINEFREYVEDLHCLIQRLGSEATAAGDARPVLVGHSMGGLIALHYALAYPETLAGLLLSSPWLGTAVKSRPVARLLAPVLSVLAPRLQIKLPGSPDQPSLATKNQEIAARVWQDPLVSHVATPRWFTEIQKAQARAFDLAPTLSLPICILQAGEERLADINAARALVQTLQVPNKFYKEYPEKYHEIFNDPGYEHVYEDVISWLEHQGLA